MKTISGGQKLKTAKKPKHRAKDQALHVYREPKTAAEMGITCSFKISSIEHSTRIVHSSNVSPVKLS